MTNSNNPLLFSGSNSIKSISRSLAEALALHSGYSNDNIIDLRDYSMQIYSDTENEKGIHDETNNLTEMIENHDILVIATPEHNSGMPAFFRSIVDWMLRAQSSYKILRGKKVILIGTSPGPGGINTLLNTKIVLEAVGAQIIGQILISRFFDSTPQIRYKTTIKYLIK